MAIWMGTMRMLYFVLIAVVIIDAFEYIKDFPKLQGQEDEDGHKSKLHIVPIILKSIPYFAVLILSIGLGVYTSVEVQVPECTASPDYDGICFSSQQAGVKIKYKLSTNDVDEAIWIEYHDGEVIPIEKDSTTVYFLATFFFKNSDRQDEEVHIDPYGRVYIKHAPPVTFTSIKADYRLRSAEPGKAGNSYDGYSLTTKDFDIRGIDPNNEEVDIEDFTFSPQTLSFGVNKIAIHCETSTKQKFDETVTVNANHPALISIVASLVEELDGRVLPGTVLTPDMFQVKGAYEDGRTETLENFEISPKEFESEGIYTVTVSMDGVSGEVELLVTTQIPISGSEDEPNDELAGATRISANTRYSGNLSDYSDVDFYRVELARKGKVWINFQHTKFDDNSTFWRITLLRSQDDSAIINMSSTGTSADTDSSVARLAPGTYYVKVEDYDYNDMNYTLMVGFSGEGDFFETESNDDYGLANEIDLEANKPYVGNLSTDDDADYYKIELSQKAKVDISLRHGKIDSSDTYWKVSVSDESDQTIAELSSRGDAMVTPMDSFRLPVGTYYIRIKPYYWNDMDYELSVQCQWEDDGAESEPNDDYGEASPLSLGKWMTGNIQNDNDKDFYKFVYKGSGNLALTFSHKRFDTSDTYWRVYLCGESSDSIRTTDDHDHVGIHGNDSEDVVCTWSGLRDGGTYYVKIDSYYSNCSDYRILVN